MPRPEGENRELSGDLEYFSMGKSGTNHIENSTLAFTKKTNRHFGIIYRVKERGGGRGNCT